MKSRGRKMEADEAVISIVVSRSWLEKLDSFCDHANLGRRVFGGMLAETAFTVYMAGGHEMFWGQALSAETFDKVAEQVSAKLRQAEEPAPPLPVNVVEFRLR